MESVYSSAIIQPDSLYRAYATVIGILDKNLVEEGDRVEVETPIIQLINIAPALNMENAKLSFQHARENFSGTSAILKSLEKEIQSASLNFRNDSINFLRQKRLWEQNIGSKLDYENRKLAYELSGNNLQVLEEEYERTRNDLSIQVRQALNTYKSSEYSSGEFTVTSKINGLVYALYKEPGEIVNTVEPLALIGSANNFIIELLVDELDIVKLEVGQKTLVTLDAYGSRVFEARIKKIYPAKDESTQTFMIEAVFVKDPPKLFPGLVGEANIVVAEKEDALVIPKEFLLDENQVLTEDGPVKIVTGLQDMEYIEIISGIEENEPVYKPEQ
ncbi:MAG TPA: efflux RND transporter periplasmic adaptor subunit [Salegentibacter sp.]|nr:efflux RND transporter periplasmic adaptor subunit [Salegentibacter sp.]